MIVPVVIIVFNAIVSVINLIKRNIKNGILSIVIAISWILFFTSHSTVIQLIVYFVSLILSIINLIFSKQLTENRRTKIPIILFSIFIIIESFLIITPIIMFMININNLKNSLSKLQEEKNLETYVYKKDDIYIFLDNKGNKITTKDYDEVFTQAYPGGFLYNLKVNNNVANLGVAKKSNKVIIINSQGEEIFTLCNLFDDYFIVATDFMNYVVRNKKFEIQMDTETLSNSNYTRSENILQRYIESDKETNDLFEENENYEYMYFKNNKISLQVVIKNDEKEEDSKLAKYYTELSFNEELNRDVDKIEEFYRNKKEYYLLDINNGTRRQLECNNLIYEAYYNEQNKLCETILLYSDGSIPFYDTEESGYFEETGEKVGINTSFLIEDVNEDYRIIINKETGATYFMSVQTGKVEKQIEDTLFIYNNFYIKSTSEEDDEYKLLDRNLNEIITSQDKPRLFGNNFIVVTSGDNWAIYYYDNKSIELIDKVNPYKFVSINSPSNDIKENGESIYYTVGIITYE